MAHSSKRKADHVAAPSKKLKENELNTESTDDLKIADKFGAAAAAKVKPVEKTPSSTSDGQAYAIETSVKDDSRDKPRDQEKHKRLKKHKDSTTKKLKPAASPLMLVTVNDRLGTKKEIPCLGSDTISDFKKLVAMHVGRQPHEIMLKRQSERALKDQLTLDDYEISNGVQLDLELNTGD